MSQSLPPDLVKATTGQYSIPIKAILSEAWHRVKGIKKSFWGGFALLFVSLTGICFLFFLFKAETTGKIFFEVLRWFMDASLVFLALRHLQHQVIKATMVFEFRKAWKPLTLMAIFYLIVFVVIWLMLLFLVAAGFTLSKFYGHASAIGFEFGLGILCIPFLFLFTYVFMLMKMNMLLILDKKIPAKKSFCIAFKSINRHLFKNMALVWLAGLLFLGLNLVTLGIGVIWLLPFMSLVSAIQYRQIFCQEASA